MTFLSSFALFSHRLPHTFLFSLAGQAKSLLLPSCLHSAKHLRLALPCTSLARRRHPLAPVLGAARGIAAAAAPPSLPPHAATSATATSLLPPHTSSPA